MAWSNKRDKELQERAFQVIPNGMYGHESVAIMPDDFPQFFTKAAGTRLWDSDGNEYIDYMCAYGPNLMGYARPEVQSAIAAQLALGDTMTGPGPGIVELAETFVSMVRHADWAVFCKNGSDATSIAMVTARAYRGKKRSCWRAAPIMAPRPGTRRTCPASLPKTAPISSISITTISTASQRPQSSPATIWPAFSLPLQARSILGPNLYQCRIRPRRAQDLRRHGRAVDRR